MKRVWKNLHTKNYVYLGPFTQDPWSKFIVHEHLWDISDVCIKFGENWLKIVEMYASIIPSQFNHLSLVDNRNK